MVRIIQTKTLPRTIMLYKSIVVLEHLKVPFNNHKQVLKNPKTRHPFSFEEPSVRSSTSCTTETYRCGIKTKMSPEHLNKTVSSGVTRHKVLHKKFQSSRVGGGGWGEGGGLF